MSVAWQDESRNRSQGTCFVAQHGRIRISVVYGHLMFPSGWVCHCPALDMNTDVLKATTAEEAKAEALRKVEAAIQRLLHDYNALTGKGD